MICFRFPLLGLACIGRGVVDSLASPECETSLDFDLEERSFRGLDWGDFPVFRVVARSLVPASGSCILLAGPDPGIVESDIFLSMIGVLNVQKVSTSSSSLNGSRGYKEADLRGVLLNGALPSSSESLNGSRGNR